MVERAASSDADAVLLDLDDAGPVEEKRATLDAAIRAITNLDWGSKVLAVRLNAVDTPLIDDQLDLLSGLKRLDSLLLRKVEQVNAVIMIGDRLSGKKRRSADSRGA
jgi:malyl-CoA/(S)-citramalyl-CoA lyase